LQPLDELADHEGARGVREACKLLEVVLDLQRSDRPAARCADKQGPFGGWLDFVELADW
jgi:hypothetical protein